jgi:hypothetical protein
MQDLHQCVVEQSLEFSENLERRRVVLPIKKEEGRCNTYSFVFN